MRRAEQVLTGGGAVNRAKFDEVSWSRSVSTVYPTLTPRKSPASPRNR